MQIRRNLDRESGAAAVEFALVLPILVLLVMGIVEFSRAYNAKEALQYAVREGARSLAIYNDPSVVPQLVKDRAIALDATKVTVPTPAACPDSPDSDDAATVTATYSLDYNIPLFKSGTWTLEATGVMRCNG